MIALVRCHNLWLLSRAKLNSKLPLLNVVVDSQGCARLFGGNAKNVGAILKRNHIACEPSWISNSGLALFDLKQIVVANFWIWTGVQNLTCLVNNTGWKIVAGAWIWQLPNSSDSSHSVNSWSICTILYTVSCSVVRVWNGWSWAIFWVDIWVFDVKYS